MKAGVSRKLTFSCEPSAAKVSRMRPLSAMFVTFSRVVKEMPRDPSTQASAVQMGVQDTSHSLSSSDDHLLKTISGFDASLAGKEQSQYRSPVTKPMEDKALRRTLFAVAA